MSQETPAAVPSIDSAWTPRRGPNAVQRFNRRALAWWKAPLFGDRKDPPRWTLLLFFSPQTWMFYLVFILWSFWLVTKTLWKALWRGMRWFKGATMRFIFGPDEETP